MASAVETEIPIHKIVVRVKVGEHRMAGSDDPFFLRLVGPGGREFRLLLAKGKTLRKGAEDVFSLGPPEDPETNVAFPVLNDPTQPVLNFAHVERISLHKTQEPIPNVRGIGELDDRLELEEISVEIYAADRPEPHRFNRSGPLWLGLVCGLSIELADADKPA